MGLHLIMAATNLRETTWGLLDWERLSHGSLLAACAHVLSEGIDRLLVPSGWVPRYMRPWGSHPDTDPLFSSSSLEILHHAHTIDRNEKIRYLTSHQVAMDHLRVCWRSQRGDNCHRCVKCLRTMAILEVFDALSRCRTLDREAFDLSRFDDLYLGEFVEFLPELEALAVQHSKRKLAGAIGRSIRHSKKEDRSLRRRVRRNLRAWILPRPRIRHRLRGVEALLSKWGIDQYR